MLQRSPTYVLVAAGPRPDRPAGWRGCRSRIRYPIVRWKQILLPLAVYQLASGARRSSSG